MHERVLISAADLADLMKTTSVVLIDTRDAANYAEAHLPGAVNIHEIFTYLAMSTPEGVTALRETFTEAFGKAGLSGKETTVVYEHSMTTGFGQSCRGYVLLRYLGYPRDKIKVLHGGFSAWRAAALPSTTDIPTPKPVRFPLAVEGSSILVGLEEMKEAVADPHVVKLDVRDVDEWIGESSSPYGKDFCPRKGRIPGSVWLEWLLARVLQRPVEHIVRHRLRHLQFTATPGRCIAMCAPAARQPEPDRSVPPPAPSPRPACDRC